MATGTVFFSGKLSASNVSKTTFTLDDISWTSPLVGKVTLGGDGPGTGWRDYTVTVNPSWSFAPPGVPLGPDGSIYVDVKITPGTAPQGDGETPGQTPEPASLVLASLGLPMLVLIRRRLKKAQADANLA